MFKESFYVRVFLLARQGLTNAKIAKALGVSRFTFNKWVRKKNALREALDLGREEIAKDRNAGNFYDYIYGKLSPRLQRVWDRIRELEKEKNGLRRIELLLQQEGKIARMNLFIHALISKNFSVTKACRSVQISYEEFKKWCLEEPDFHRLVEEMEVHKKNFYEEALVKLVEKGDVSAVLFANRTYNRDRGYAEKQEVRVSGNVAVSHKLVDLERLQLPLEIKRQLLEAIRRSRDEQHQPAQPVQPARSLEECQPVRALEFRNNEQQLPVDA